MKSVTLILLVSLAALASCTTEHKEDLKDGVEAVKDAGTEVGHATRDAGVAVGHAARDVTRETGHFFRDIFSGDDSEESEENDDSED